MPRLQYEQFIHAGGERIGSRTGLGAVASCVGPWSRLYAFNGLFADAGNIYSHVLFADVIFQSGLPGVALMSGFCIS